MEKKIIELITFFFILSLLILTRHQISGMFSQCPYVGTLSTYVCPPMGWANSPQQDDVPVTCWNFTSQSSYPVSLRPQLRMETSAHAGLWHRKDLILLNQLISWHHKELIARWVIIDWPTPSHSGQMIICRLVLTQTVSQLQKSKTHHFLRYLNLLVCPHGLLSWTTVDKVEGIATLRPSCRFPDS